MRAGKELFSLQVMKCLPPFFHLQPGPQEVFVYVDICVSSTLSPIKLWLMGREYMNLVTSMGELKRERAEKFFDSLKSVILQLI